MDAQTQQFHNEFIHTPHSQTTRQKMNQQKKRKATKKKREKMNNTVIYVREQGEH